MSQGASSKTTLTNRGWRVVYTSLALGALGLLFRDPFVLVGVLALVALLLYEVGATRGVVKRIWSLVKVEPDVFEAATSAGKTFTFDFEVSSSAGLPLLLKSPLEGGTLQPEAVGQGVARLRFEFQPRLAGRYGCETLRVRVRGRFGLIVEVGELPFSLALKVYPRVLAAAIAAASFLLAAGGLGVGERPTELKGAGLEYAGSREYVAGDTLRHMDWKATARLSRLVVKELYVEGGVGAHLAYEAVAPDPASVDELSTAFLNTALAMARQGLPLGLTVHDGKRVWLHVSRVQPALAVGLALKYALRAVEADPEELYVVLEPKAASELRRILERLDQTPMRQLLEAELRALKDAVTEPYKVLERLLGAGGERSQLILASSLARDPMPVLELAGMAQRKGRPLLILQPTRPWIGAPSLGEAYRLYERYARLNRILESHGVPVAASAERLSRHFLAVETLTRYAR